MWLGTWDGLNLYNGITIKCFKPDPSEPGSISNTVIRSIMEEADGIFWVATDLGINRYDESSGEFSKWFNDAEALNILGENAFKICKSPDNTIYVFIDGNGAYRFKTKGFEKILEADNFSNALFDAEGRLWVLHKNSSLHCYVFGADGSIAGDNISGEEVHTIFGNSHGSYIFIQHNDGRISRFSAMLGASEDIGSYPLMNCAFASDEALLLGGEFGLISLDLNSRSRQVLASDVNVLSVIRGSQDIIWAGTDMLGVWEFLPENSGNFIAFPDKSEDLFSGRAIRCFSNDPAYNLLVGTKGRGVYLFDHKNRILSKRYSTENGMINNSVYAMAMDSRGLVWMGTDGNGLNYLERGQMKKLRLPEDCRLSSVYDILPWKENELWIGTSGNGLFHLVLDIDKSPVELKSYRQFRMGKDKALSSNIIYALEKKDDDNIWIGTRGGGVSRYCISDDSFTSLSNAVDRRDVLSLLSEENGSLWVGTSTGLFIFPDTSDPDNYVKLDEKKHLPNNTIHGMLKDDAGHTWASTNNGLACIQCVEGEYTIVPYYAEDGLYGNEFSDGAAFAFTKDFFLFGNINGITAFDPNAVKPNEYIPQIVLESFRIDNADVHINEYIDQETGVMEAPRGVKSISFTFVPVDYINSNKRSLSYAVDGMLSDWIDLGHSGTIVLTKLKPGNYTLKVRCSGPEGAWLEDGATIPFHVPAAWYASAWAIAIYIFILLLTGGLSIAFARQTARNRKERRMRRIEKEKIAAVHEAKLNFFTVIAHEFSNSLTLIYGPCVQILRNPSTDYTTRHYAHLIEKNSERMRTMIQELLDFRKAETGHLSIRCNKVDMQELTDRNLEYFAEELVEKNISIKAKVEPEGLYWQTDRNLVDKILFNFISNAVKYTPGGYSIEIAIEKEEDMLSMRVTNHGVGMSDDQRKIVFNSYEVLRKYERNVARGKNSSNGIGLATCKDFAEQLGGTIECLSDGNSYVCLAVRLPQMEGTPEEMIETSSDDQWRTMQYFTPSHKRKDNQENSKPKGRSLLIVDDDEEILSFISGLFEDKFDIELARNGEEALASVRQQVPAVIISDVVMPKMNGIELVKALKNDEITRRIPVILLSTKNTVEDQVKGLSEGADRYVSKPFNPKHLSAVVDSLLNRDKAVMEYSNSSVAAMDLYSGKVVTKETKRLLSKVTDVIMKNISNENMTLDDIAEQTATSKMKIYRAMKASLEMTPTEYIRSIRLQHAEKLLRTTKKTVQEIMYECGFSSKAYFHKVFSAKYGHTPKEYRDSR